MHDKQKIVEAALPLAVLEALTPEAINAIPDVYLLGENMVAIFRFPFRVGRESRLTRMEGELHPIVRPTLNGVVPNNDLYLIDPYLKINIGREHFQIERHQDVFMVVDRGSTTGTRLIRDDSGIEEAGSSFVLQDGDVICLGDEGSPFLYRFHSFDDVKFSIAN